MRSLPLPSHRPTNTLLPLIRTLFDITLLRRGPDAIPRSGLLLAMVVVLWIVASLAGLALIDRLDETDFFLGLLTGFSGITCYAAVVVFGGFAPRLTQTLTALVGCGALIFLVFVAQYTLFLPIAGDLITGLVANLILLWSVPVEGHIIARAIDRHWYTGILIAITVFALQYILYSFIAPAPTA
jgi:hypothetical protein